MDDDAKKKIFIVDDDKFLREMYVTKFSASGFEVDSAGSVREAMEKLIDSEKTPDVLLFDIIMPQEDGWDLAQKIKDQNLIKDAKRIVLSNQGEESDVEKSKEFNVDGYIIKALTTPSEVVEKVKEISEK
jgi:CheY-like chemotaxis protein